MTDPAAFSQSWTAEILNAPPMIAPARHFVWPLRVPGEDEALARGALQLLVRPAAAASYLVTCALGFADPALPTGVFACPDQDQICALAGGYAYLANAAAPERCTLLPLKPVVSVIAAVPAGLLLFVGFTSISAWGRNGFEWQTQRLSWEGVRIVSTGARELSGYGWDLLTDREVEFGIDLSTGAVRGGPFPT